MIEFRPQPAVDLQSPTLFAIRSLTLGTEHRPNYSVHCKRMHLVLRILSGSDGQGFPIGLAISICSLRNFSNSIAATPCPEEWARLTGTWLSKLSVTARICRGYCPNIPEPWQALWAAGYVFSIGGTSIQNFGP